MPDPEVRRTRFCIRAPECEGMAEPEQDGEVTYFKCAVCEHEFGYQVAGIAGDGDCQLGIPEGMRAAFSFDPIVAPSGDPRIFLGSTIRVRRAEDDTGA